MRLILTVNTKGAPASDAWTEEMDADDLPHPGGITRRRNHERESVATTAEATDYGDRLIAAFNKSRMAGERERVFISAELKPAT